MFGKSSSTAPRLLKFETPKDPIELENAKREWEIPHVEKLAYIESKFREKQYAIDNDREMRSDDKMAIKNAMQVYLQQLQLEAWDSAANECYIKEFRDFLQGKSKYNTQEYKHLVPWTNNALVGKDIDAYIDAVIDKKIAFDSKIVKMFNTRLAPRNLQDAWLYFVFICKGKKPPTDIFLKSWDAFYPYDDTRNGNDNPQKDWRKHPEDAQEREDQKGTTGPKETCEEGKNVDWYEIPGYDSKPVLARLPNHPLPEEHIEGDPVPSIPKDSQTVELSDSDQISPTGEDDDEDDDIEAQLSRRRTNANRHVEEQFPGDDQAMQSVAVFFEANENVNRINQETEDENAQRAIERHQSQVAETYTTGVQQSKMPRRSLRLIEKANRQAFAMNARINRMEQVGVLRYSSAVQMLEETKKEREAMTDFKMKLKEKYLGKSSQTKNLLATQLQDILKLMSENELLKATASSDKIAQASEVKTLQSEAEWLKSEIKNITKAHQELQAVHVLLQQAIASKNQEIQQMTASLTEHQMRFTELAQMNQQNAGTAVLKTEEVEEYKRITQAKDAELASVLHQAREAHELNQVNLTENKEKTKALEEDFKKRIAEKEQEVNQALHQAREAQDLNQINLAENEEKTRQLEMELAEMKLKFGELSKMHEEAVTEKEQLEQMIEDINDPPHYATEETFNSAIEEIRRKSDSEIDQLKLKVVELESVLKSQGETQIKDNKKRKLELEQASAAIKHFENTAMVLAKPKLRRVRDILSDQNKRK